jgi:hypothetical protein
VAITTSDETTPNAMKAYTVGTTAGSRPPPGLVVIQYTIAPAAKPAVEAISLGASATSSLAPHLGHSMLLDFAAAMVAEISVPQCGQTRLATYHLSDGACNNKRIGGQKKSEKRDDAAVSFELQGKVAFLP